MHTKDPSPVFDGATWHLFGTAGTDVVSSWYTFHATAPHAQGPWTEQPPAEVRGFVGPRASAPGVLFDAGVFHMFIHTDFVATGGSIEYLMSEDGGQVFKHVGTALKPADYAPELGVYDAHPAIISGSKYLTYAAMNADLHGLWANHAEHESMVRGPDIFLARSVGGSWAGPWERRGLLLRQEDVPYHCPPGHPDYEWGLEGPQLIELPDSRLLLAAVCFLRNVPRGRRQRVFLAAAQSPADTFRPLGVLPTTSASWECAENGHPGLLQNGDDIYLFYQARGVGLGTEQTAHPWRCGVARAPTWDWEAWVRQRMPDLSGQ